MQLSASTEVIDALQDSYIRPQKNSNEPRGGR